MKKIKSYNKKKEEEEENFNVIDNFAMSIHNIYSEVYLHTYNPRREQK